MDSGGAAGVPSAVTARPTVLAAVERSGRGAELPLRIRLGVLHEFLEEFEARRIHLGEGQRQLLGVGVSVCDAHDLADRTPLAACHVEGHPQPLAALDRRPDLHETEAAQR